ncbi:TIGR01777 family oxidoreductase [Actinoplanes sp. NPDC049265]|uniref:TIGR01777 family oxidoreductase n=1 Tax=Actinoplanes sp. NPDC049265 TaxID=3363902 RepID=UPI0037107363
MRILMAGASGFLGVPLAKRLREAGHDVTRLVRRPAESTDEATWSPSQGQLDPALVAGADAVINLAGAGVGDKRWTAAYRSVIRSSRVDTTGTIARAIKHLPAADRPRTLLQGSAEGWYGETGDRRVTEDSPAGRGFLADVVRVWEAAARPAEDAGTRVVLLRSGLPLHQDGGLLKPQMPIFRAGLGGRLGSGRQYLPWLSLEDWLRAVEFLLDQEEISGPVNVVGPEPVTNAEFAETLGRVLHRPAVTFVPGFALQIALGGFAEEALGSKRVMPGVLSRAGFRWNHPTLESALRVAVGQTPSAAS